eukprot:6183881-Pleurochrysis_carterae.AAC.1
MHVNGLAQFSLPLRVLIFLPPAEVQASTNGYFSITEAVLLLAFECIHTLQESFAVASGGVSHARADNRVSDPIVMPRYLAEILET